MIEVVRSALDEIRDAKAMGVRYLQRHLPTRHATQRIPIKGYGTMTMRRESSDAHVFRQVFTAREYDLRQFAQWASIEACYRRVLQSGRRPLIIDAGANNGASARWFSYLFADAHVVAIEPEPGNAEVCRRNTADRDVRVLEQALSSQPGAVNVITAERDAWEFMTERSAEGTIPTCTINGIVSELGPAYELFLVKIDVEGFEADVFASNTDWIDAAKVVILEPHDWMLPGRQSSSTFQAEMGQRGYELLLSGENLVYVRPEPAALAISPVG